MKMYSPMTMNKEDHQTQVFPLRVGPCLQYCKTVWFLTMCKSEVVWTEPSMPSQGSGSGDSSSYSWSSIEEYISRQVCNKLFCLSVTVAGSQHIS